MENWGWESKQYLISVPLIQDIRPYYPMGPQKYNERSVGWYYLARCPGEVDEEGDV